MMTIFPKYKKNWLLFFSSLFAACILFLSIPLGVLPARETIPSTDKFENPVDSLAIQLKLLKESIIAEQNRILQLKQKWKELEPKKPYLIVNTTRNQIRLISDRRIIRKARCSTGSYILLKTKGQRQWLFKTPRGLHRVTVKLTNPYWYKPDWAYIEENLPIPSIYSPKRYQPNVLGEYALGFGHGYLVHGTIYKRFLGMPVTHGCVRLDDEAMRLVFKTLTHGSRIYIY
jgi:hypothetical protein